MVFYHNQGFYFVQKANAYAINFENTNFAFETSVCYAEIICLYGVVLSHGFMHRWEKPDTPRFLQ